MKYFKSIILFFLKKYHTYKLKKFKYLYSILLDRVKINFIDIGASIQIIQRWKKIDKQNLNYHLFEPNKSEIKKLLKNKKYYDNYHLYDVALSNKAQKRKLFITKGIYQSSFLKPNFDFLKKFQDSERYKISKIENIKAKMLDQIKINNPDFIKIDVQGFNYQILQGSKKTLKKTIGIDIEVEFQEIYKNEFLFGQTNDFLIKNNFEFIDFTYLCRWERNNFNGNGQCIFGNAIYLKKPDLILKCNKSLITKYIAIAVLYNKFDLAEYVLKKTPKIKNKNDILNVIMKLNKYSAKADSIKSISNGIIKFFDLDYNMHLFK